jgi:DNA-binding NtrC family response regulator
MNTAQNSVRRNILVVDDEQSIVNAVRRELLTPPFGRYRYEIEGFTSPYDALQRAREQEFEVVISDYRMPEMDGIMFLKSLVNIQPDCARIVLSGQTEFDALIRMINETQIYRFIPKPWSSYFLKSSISQAIELRSASLENRMLADSLRARGIALPPHVLNPVDHILVVDDDMGMAQSVVRCLTERSALDTVLRMVSEERTNTRPAGLESMNISVQISNTPIHALKMAEVIEYACVISEFKLPGTDGSRLLIEFNERHPDCESILMSDSADMDGLINALDLAHIHAFLAKPWVAFVLRTTVVQALARRRLRIENRALAELCKTSNLIPWAENAFVQ